jgi:murein DD-endopeptidase MepM/ murein hydrolase activator NlpD
MYDYLSVHQTGKITYPGESLGPENGGIDGFDPTMQFYISWTTTDHPNDAYDGNLYNPGIYYTNSVEFINTVTGLNLSDTPVPGRVLVAACQGSASSRGSGLVDSTGYSFPLAPQTKSVGGIVENQTVTRHHDETPAFDLFSTDSADVYAIYDGVIDSVNNSYGDIQGCTSIMLYADDTYYYWYGHLKNPTVREGDRVTAGQKIAELADQSFTNACFGSAPHLHIDRGCVIGGEPQPAGRDICRDPDFIPFLSSLYSGLGN